MNGHSAVDRKGANGRSPASAHDHVDHELELRSISHALEATLTVNLESLAAGSDQVLPLTARESVVLRDLNEDGKNVHDVVATVRDRETGELQSIPAWDGYGPSPPGTQIWPACGTQPTSAGRAIIEIHDPPLRIGPTKHSFLTDLAGKVYYANTFEGHKDNRLKYWVFRESCGSFSVDLGRPEAAAARTSGSS